MINEHYGKTWLRNKNAVRDLEVLGTKFYEYVWQNKAIRNSAKDFLVKCKDEAEGYKEVGTILKSYYATGEISNEDAKIVRRKFIDTLKISGLLVLMIPPGGQITVIALIKLAHKYNIDFFLPSNWKKRNESMITSFQLFESYKNEKAKEFFLEKLNGCYQVTRENKFSNYIYWVYDPEKAKDKAFNRASTFGFFGSGLNDEDFKEIRDKVIFWQELENEYFYISYKKIWSVFESKFRFNYQEIKDLTTGWLNEHTKLKQYTTAFILNGTRYWLNEHCC